MLESLKKEVITFKKAFAIDSEPARVKLREFTDGTRCPIGPDQLREISLLLSDAADGAETLLSGQQAQQLELLLASVDYELDVDDLTGVDTGYVLDLVRRVDGLLGEAKNPWKRAKGGNDLDGDTAPQFIDETVTPPHVGYVWHGMDPPASSNVTTRTSTDGEGRITGCVVAGRPRGKHGGEQGQHSTAFVVHRESVQAAVVGRTEDFAKQNMVMLILNLGRYPCFHNEALMKQLPDKVRAQLDTDLKASHEDLYDMSLDDLVVAYVELRDALPGASLIGETHGDTTGSAEGTAVGKLRDHESSLLAGTEPGPEAAEEALENMAAMFDKDVLAKLSPGQKRDQLETFFLSIAQAFPCLFGAPNPAPESIASMGATLGDALITRMMNAHFSDEFSKHLARIDDTEEERMRANARAASGFAVMPNELRTRPGAPPLAAALKFLEDGTVKLRLQGRPESVKSGGAMGDHTTSMRMMKSAVAGALLVDGKLPSCAQLADRFQEILDQTDPQEFADIYTQGVIPTAEDWQNDQEGLQETDYVKRLDLMGELHRTLQAEVIDLRTHGDEPCGEEYFLLAAENALGLLDLRPTAVNHAGVVSRGKSEGKHGKELDAMEQSGKFGRIQALPDKLCTLFDVSAAADIHRDADLAIDRDRYLDKVVQEFEWFCEKSYPKAWAAVESREAGSLGKHLRGLIEDFTESMEASASSKKRKR